MLGRQWQVSAFVPTLRRCLHRSEPMLLGLDVVTRRADGLPVVVGELLATDAEHRDRDDVVDLGGVEGAAVVAELADASVAFENAGFSRRSGFQAPALTSQRTPHRHPSADLNLSLVSDAGSGAHFVFSR
jgi:hypothetical protein